MAQGVLLLCLTSNGVPMPRALASFLLLLSLIVPARSKAAELPEVALERLLGTWFEQSSVPQVFTRGCVASRATYTLRDDGMLNVLNECRKETLDGPWKSVTGRARLAEPERNPARLEVSFFGPFWADYWVVARAPDYSWIAVS